MNVNTFAPLVNLRQHLRPLFTKPAKGRARKKVVSRVRE